MFVRHEFMEGRKKVNNEIVAHGTSTIRCRSFKLLVCLLERDRRSNVSEICSKSGIGYGSTQSIIIKDLGLRKVSAQWVTRTLAAEVGTFVSGSARFA